MQKLEDFDASLKAKESGGVSISVHFLVETAKLFASICCRQPRALQMCAGMLERIVKLNSSVSNIKPEDEAVVLSQLGYVFAVKILSSRTYILLISGQIPLHHAGVR